VTWNMLGSPYTGIGRNLIRFPNSYCVVPAGIRPPGTEFLVPAIFLLTDESP